MPTVAAVPGGFYNRRVMSSAEEVETDREDRLAALLEQLLSDAAVGRAVDIDGVCRTHPDLADELRSLWATAEIAGLLAGTVLSDDPAEPNGGRSPLAFSPASDALDDPLDDYELIEELGRGGMGVVYRARQKSLGRTVALKMIVRPDLAGPADVARFRGEAEAAARLEHPHIVPIYEVGTTGGAEERPYFTMRLVEGETLAQRLAAGPLEGSTTARLLAPICRAVHEAHLRGLVHRDLKPSNILIDVDGRPYVTDFGLAKRHDTKQEHRETSREPQRPEIARSPVADAPGSDVLTATGAILGTPSYMSPEQAAGRRKIGPAADVYSLGAVLYACLTGRPPFQAASAAETVLMVLDHDPLPPRLVNPQADADLELIALKALQKPADLRYVSAAALADDLDAYLAHEPIAARSTRMYDVLSRAFRETHHAQVLENWGLLWMWHGVALLTLCLVTNALQLQGVASRWPYLLLWTAGLGVWASIFWSLRRRAGPVTFVERQIAHAWAGSMVCSTLLYLVEALLGLPVLTLSPVLALVSGLVFLMKAAILSGLFYIPAAALFLIAPLMALWPRLLHAPNLAITLFGVVSAASFMLPGWKYWRQANGSRSVL